MACVVLLAGLLIMVRNVYGVVSVLITGAVLVGVMLLASAAVRTAVAELITWLLLFGGLRPVGELQRQRWHRRAYDSDADQLARLTGAPGFFWVGSFALIGLGALVLSGGWLLG